jgi:membrane-bound serine protease (ClpP class)
MGARPSPAAARRYLSALLATPFRLLGTIVVAAGVLLGTAGGAHAAAPDRAQVDVVQVNGLIDPVVADFVHHSIVDAGRQGAAVLVLQVNSGGGVLSPARMDALVAEIQHAKVPVAVWVGPSGGRAEGAAFRIVRAAAVAGTSTRTRLGNPSPSASTSAVPDPLAGRTIGSTAALEQQVVTIDAPTLGDFVIQLDGKQANGQRLALPSTVIERPGRPPQRQPDVDVALSKLDLVGRLLHTAASPSVAYLLLIVGSVLVLFEFFTAGVGVAAVVGGGFLMLSAYGLGVLPIRPWALVAIVVGLLGFAIDVQAGVPRLWTAVGTILLVVGTLTLYHQVHLSWLATGAGVLGTALMMVAGMPAVVRSRFSTPTIGRESIIGELGTALADVSPDGTVEVRGAQWRARTNRATPIPAGDRIRVVAIDGLLLEVEPEVGGARDARH